MIRSLLARLRKGFSGWMDVMMWEHLPMVMVGNECIMLATRDQGETFFRITDTPANRAAWEREDYHQTVGRELASAADLYYADQVIKDFVKQKEEIYFASLNYSLLNSETM